MPRPFKIMYSNKCIGEASFISIDKGMGIALGRFIPTPSYEEVRPVFHLFIIAMLAREEHIGYEDTLKDYYRKRDELHLYVKADDGQLIPSEWIHIIDLQSEEGNYEIEVKLSEYIDVEKLHNEELK